MQRIIGNRPLLFIATFLALGIAIGSLFLLCPIGYGISFLGLCFFCTLLFCAIKKIRKYFLLPLAFFVGVATCIFSSLIYTNQKVDFQKQEFVGDVCSEITVDGNLTTFDVENIVCNNQNVRGKCKIYVYNLYDIDFNAGDSVKILGNLKSNDFVPFDTYFSYQYAKKMTLEANVYSVEKYQEKSPNLFLKCKMKLKKAFYTSTKEDTASICLALIYGDKSNINKKLYNDIKVSGLAHILAVSGLHISILSGFLWFCLKKVKVPPRLAMVVVLGSLFVYAMFCGFPPSIVRAFIMSAVFMIGSAFGEKTDSLSALSLAAIVILIFNPLMLYNIGFLLSFSAVFGIVVYHKTFSQISKKKNKIVDIGAMSLSANLFTYPLTASCFGTFPVFFIISNIIILPIMSVVYMLLLIFAGAVLILPFSSILVVFDYILIPLKAVALFFGSFSISSIAVQSLGIFSIAYYFDFVCLSRFVFLSKRKKMIAVSIVTSFFAILALLLGIIF